MNRQVLQDIRDHHASHIAWVTAHGFSHLDITKHQEWIAELDAILAQDWMSKEDLFSAFSSVIGAPASSQVTA